MPLETAIYIDGLVTTNPLGSDPLSAADDHIRLIKSSIKNTFPNISAAVTATEEDLNQAMRKDGSTMTGPLVLSGNPTTNLQAATKQYVDSVFPTGGIIIWSGTLAAVPSGWALCNGTNGTPDLRDRFVVGAGSTYAVGATGGSKDAIVVAHSHTATSATAGSHSHSYSIPLYSEIGGVNFVGDAPNNGQTGTWNGTTNTNGNHSHTITVNSTGSSGTDANLPPYYALAYIMKL